MQDRKRHDEQDKFSEITGEILGCCFDVINTLGAGFVESIYRNALVAEDWDIRARYPAYHAACDHANPVPF